MKIVHVMSWYLPNMGYQENYLPLEQKKLGHDVNIITSDRFPSYEGYKNHIGKKLGNRIVGTGFFSDYDISIYRLPCIFEFKKQGDTILIGLKQKLKQLKPDIVHIHGVFSPLTLQTVYFCKKSGCRIFIDDHCNNDNFSSNSFFKKNYLKFFKKFYKIYIKDISCFLPVTNSSKEIIQSILNIPEKKIEILHLGADVNIFKKSKELKKKRQSRN